MKVQTKRLIAVLLLICMLASTVPVISLAAETQETVNYGFNALAKYAECAKLAKKSYSNNAVDGNGVSVTDADGNPVQVKDYMAGLYTSGVINYTLEGIYTQDNKEGKNIQIRADQGHRLIAGNAGDWVAFRLKAPGAGTATITLTTTAGGNEVSVYLLEATEGLAIADSLTSANLLAAGLKDAGEYVIAENKELKSCDYILVIEHNEIGGNGYFCLTDLNIAVTRQAEPEEPELVTEDQTYYFDVLKQYAECAKLAKKSYSNNAVDGNGVSVTDADGNPVQVKDYMAGLYASGVINYTLEGI